MEPNKFYAELPKIELHAHLNGSLSQSTMLELKRYHADKGLVDKTNVFFDEFKVGAGDTRNLNDCFQVFNIAHSLTSTPLALFLATKLTLQEFKNDGCCYLELRSTPRDTDYMNKKEYMEAIVNAIIEVSISIKMISKLIVSINRSLPIKDAEEITQLAIEYNKLHPDVVLGIEVSGNPMVGKFETLVPLLEKARQESGLKNQHGISIAKKSAMAKVLLASKIIIWNECTMAHKRALEALNRTLKDLRNDSRCFGEAMILLSGDFRQTLPVMPRSTAGGSNDPRYKLPVTLHCGEIYNPQEVLEMLQFKPDRIGHGVCIHPKYGGTEDTWKLLCELKIPVEICLTSNVNTKLTPDYDSHHFKELYDADIPVIICTDDKGVFSTSLSQEYRLCAETFNLTQSQIAELSHKACEHIFSKTDLDTVTDIVKSFMESNAL